jgi:hypothetical protein
VGFLSPLFEQYLKVVLGGIDWVDSMVDGRPYEGKSQVDYYKSILDSLNNGPMRRQMLVNQLCNSNPSIMSEKKLDKTLKELADEGKIVKKSRALESRGGWETWYMLPKHSHLLDVDASKFITAVKRLKSLLLRVPTTDELAVEVGITPGEAENLAYKLASKTGWYNPSEKLIENSKVKLGEVLVCAARIREKQVDMNGESECFDYKEDASIVQEAKRFLKDHPKLLPTLSKDGENVIEWPSESLRYLRDNYNPKDRSIPIFAAINRSTGERIF